MENEWTEWDGVAFAPPIDPFASVEALFKDGTTDIAPAGFFHWQWAETGKPKIYDVTAYRFAK